jgi:hypothetical protein
MKRIRCFFAKWYWNDLQQGWQLRVTRFGRPRATVWPNGTWFTWDELGTGGENSVDDEIWLARLKAFESLQRQNWI